MSFRIGVLGAGQLSTNALDKAAQAKGGTAVSFDADGPLPPGLAVVVGGPKDAEALAGVAAALASRQEAIVLLVAQAVDAREGIPLTNAERVRATARQFGQALNLSPEDLDTLLRGALLHDIGKLELSNGILLTNAMLTHDEWSELRNHTLRGEALVKGLPGFEDTAAIVRGHHECWDGTGYPDGLEGEDIPLLARAMKLIDVFCSMTGPRHYRQGMASLDGALDHIAEETGKHFDPALAPIFIKTIRSHS